MSDYEKGQWVRKRQDLKSEITRLQREIKRKFPPSLEADINQLLALKLKLTEKKLLVS